MVDRFLHLGWEKFSFESSVLNWVSHVSGEALRAVAAPDMQRAWLRAGGTWMVGVNALDNDGAGRVGDGPPLAGAAMDLIRGLGLDALPLDRAQLSAVGPGYPRQDAGESDVAFRFRKLRDAAHVDGVKRLPGGNRRHIGESHAYLLGLPLGETGRGASPLALWEGSHDVMRAALVRALDGVAPGDMAAKDITEAYAAARREVFATCPRRLVHAQPGEAFVLHRLTLHGISPWQDGAKAPPEGRVVAYFRPALPGGVAAWLMEP